MYFVATLQPKPTKKEQDAGFFSIREKRQAIDNFYNNKKNNIKEIPLCIDHGTGESYGYVVEKENTVGKVLDLFNDEYGNIVAKCILYDDNDHFKVIRDAIEEKKEKWGVSVWIDIYLENENVDIKDAQKELTHVALTSDPYFADRNTFIHHWSYNETALDRIISKEYYSKDKGECYASDEFVEALNKFIVEEKPKEGEEEVQANATIDETPKEMVIEETNPILPSQEAQTTTIVEEKPEEVQTMVIEEKNKEEVTQIPEEVQITSTTNEKPQKMVVEEIKPKMVIEESNLMKNLNAISYCLAASRMAIIDYIE